MKQLKTYEELVAHKWRKVTAKIDGREITDARIQVDEKDVYICQDLVDGLGCKNKLGYKYSYWISDGDNITGYIKNIRLVEEKKKSHTYETIYRRDDGVEFTETTIGGVQIEELKKKEKELYSEARAIRSKLNAHANKFLKK